MGNILFGEEDEKCWWKQSLHVLKNSLVYDENEEINWNIESVENKYICFQQWNSFRNIELKLICALEENVTTKFWNNLLCKL